MRIAGGRDLAIAINRTSERARFTGINLKDGTYHTLLDVALNRQTIVWTVTDGLLLIGLGHDLIVFDLRSNHLAGVLPGIIPEGSANATIEKFLIDGPHLIVLTHFGKYSRVIDTADLLRFATQGARNFKLVDDLLLQ